MAWDFEGLASFVLMQKLKELKGALKMWNREVFGHVVVNKNEALRQIPHWDALDNVRTLSLEEMGLRVEAKESFKKWSLFDELSWRQKSREVWLKEGDMNTRFFHKMANAHKRNNQLGRICINGDWFIEGQEMKEEILRAFKNLLTDPRGWRPVSNNLSFDRIDPVEAKRVGKTFY